MLKFVRRVRGQVTPTQGPMVVHCSAGVGRTGTFIAIDILLQRMQEVGGVINVQEVVCRMRAQRGNMVQTTVSVVCSCVDPLPHNKSVWESHYTQSVMEQASIQPQEPLQSSIVATIGECSCGLCREGGLVSGE